MSELVSVVIPSRNEKYLTKTIKDILNKAVQDIEVIVILDGYWPPVKDLVEDVRVLYIHNTTPKGMRAGINAGVAIAKGKYIMKLDAHCMLDKGFDLKLKEVCKPNWVVIPRRQPLDPEKWQIEDRQDNKYPIDKMFLNETLQGSPSREKNKETIEDLMTFQGSCWFMEKDYFNWLELMDESRYGTFWQEAQEIGFKCWLSGGRVVRAINTWYAHYHKTGGRGYSLTGDEKKKTAQMIAEWKDKKVWPKQIHSLSWLYERFSW